MAKFSHESFLLNELRDSALMFRGKNELQFNGFSKASLEHYENLNELMSQMSGLEAYNETKKTFHEDVKPQITSLISDLSKIIKTQDLGFNSDPVKMVGLPNPNIQFTKKPAEWAWAALTRKGRKRREDVQFFVALKRRYLRFGLFSGKTTQKMQDRTNLIVRNIYENPNRFLEILDQCTNEGLSLTENEEGDGSLVLLEIDRNMPNVSIGDHGYFELVTALDINRLPSPEDILDIALQTFVSSRSMYEFILGDKVKHRYRLLED